MFEICPTLSEGQLVFIGCKFVYDFFMLYSKNIAYLIDINCVIVVINSVSDVLS